MGQRVSGTSGLKTLWRQWYQFQIKMGCFTDSFMPLTEKQDI